MNKYQKIITINNSSNDKELVLKSANMLLCFMFEQLRYPDYFQMRLKDSEKNPFAKDLVLKWVENE